jgi:hypothetical protein
LLERLSATERFSRTTVRTLGALDADAIRRALSDGLGDDMGPLLSERQVADVLERRATILSHVAALVDERGEADVLVFP